MIKSATWARATVFCGIVLLWVGCSDKDTVSASQDAGDNSVGSNGGAVGSGGAEQASSNSSSSGSVSSSSSSSGGAECTPACALGYQCVDGACAPNPTCCEAGTNVGPGEPNPPPMPDAYVAWPFVATCDIDVNQVQLYTDGGTWWIAADNNGMIGAVLTSGALPQNPLPQWTGAPPTQIIHLYAGHAYWIIQGTAPKPTITTASIAEYGKLLPFRHSATLAGPWAIGDKLMRFAANMTSGCP